MAEQPDAFARRPSDSPWLQQSVPGHQTLPTPRNITVALACMGATAVAIGLGVRASGARELFSRKQQYGGHDTPAANAGCQIDDANEGRACQVSMSIEKDMAPPVHVYYEIDNFYQNHNRYMSSYVADQLLGTEGLSSSDLAACTPLKKNGSRLLSPCGVIANSMFSDVITLANEDLTMRETNLAWDSDHHDKFKQPRDFEWAATDESVASCVKTTCAASLCEKALGRASCMGYVCKGGDFDAGHCAAGANTVYYYKDHETYQYLYETYPDIVSPLVGVKNEHFQVWMRLGGLRDFRKPYGRITSKLKKGDVLTFNVTSNFNVKSFSGKKHLVVATANELGGNPVRALWEVFVGVGAACLGAALLFAAKGQALGWRTLGDTAFLRE